jgi:hypothetical protein
LRHMQFLPFLTGDNVVTLADYPNNVLPGKP